MIKQEAEKTAKDAAGWMARAGYGAKGLVYTLMGVFVLQAAFGISSSKVDTNIVLLRIFSQPYGRWLLALLALGLASFAGWRILQAVIDPEGEHGRELKGLAARAGSFVTGLAYAGLTLAAMELVLGYGGGTSTEEASERVTGMFIATPVGRALVMIAGGVVLGAGIYTIYRALTDRFETDLDGEDLSHGQRKWAIRLGRFGHMVWGPVYLVIGIFFLQAAIRLDADSAGGFGEAIQALADQSYGPWALGIVGAGLAAYGVYFIILALFRRMRL